MEVRHNWTHAEVRDLMEKPFMDLLFEAQLVHRQYQQTNHVQVSTLLSIKTGACPEDCKYCPQSARYTTDIEKERLMEVERVLDAAQKAKNAGSTRFCMGAAWKNPKERDMPHLTDMIKGVKDMGLETCMTLGMLTPEQAKQLANAGLDYYNHNLDTSPEFYGNIITTRTYQDRLDTLSHVRDAGMKICSGGIIGMGESANDRAGLLVELANLPTHPESVPINMLVKVKGTPLETVDDVDPFDFIRLIAIARIMMPQSAVRLSAGRENMNEQMQALCFMAGANSVFYGCKLLTTPNPSEDKDMMLFKKLGINSQEVSQKPDEIEENELLDRVVERVAARPTKDDLFYDASV
ncbi:biotin synthase BioB [Vibrio parahaemolyticus]|uniref:Biotin synthase n=6 Tax=Vibrio TaxID=662 RepID=BIOB_VIBPA|nr:MULTISPECIES: biotin synthase BioB [Vibrio]Q87QN6.1 RecName: Full=Biotin synthase [Vibrio parahaemolyticus RIMD 2210633]EFO36716.1 biotin synthase [Vibrio parahaemolyticus Peru-466]EFO48209.1 biotin synthase [Vibrio parahaemolyticus AQ4037]EFO52147.1 biotin synthase [Vibrio parahaemolyticus K5030]EJG0920644.1 biotin synthase BioB [Vibrio parahaemolyticus O1:K68]EJG0930259.1 biotin synthase BioB [Vibrio parahaemolyticus O1]EJG0944471.1 biotin synthase BioB [Vibrio parahaemolyticus O10]EQM